MLVVIASGWVGFYAADQIICDGRLLPVLPPLARSIAAGFGFHL
jgi:hypothetical protein